MAGVTSDLLVSILKTNLNNLKSFAELLNAELSEDPQGDENRESQRTDMVKILQEFGEAEAFFEKGRKCLQKVEQEVRESYSFNCSTDVADESVLSEIKSVIRSLEGKERTQDSRDEQNFDSGSTGLMQQIEDIREVLRDINHPLNIDEPDDEEYDYEEENRMVKELEDAQKRALVNTDDDEEFRVANLCELDDGDVDIAPNSFERIGRSSNDNRNVGTDKVDQLQHEYKNKLVHGSSVCAKQLYDSKNENEADVDIRQLPLLTKYKESILELFSNDAIVVLEKKQTYTDPISKIAIRNPVRNKICEHVYERDTIYSLLKNKKTMACPCCGCSCRSFSMKDLEEDEEIAERIAHSQARARRSEALAAENAETDDEVGPEDDTQSQEIL